MSTRNVGPDGRAIVGGDNPPIQQNPNQVTGAPIIGPRPQGFGAPRGPLPVSAISVNTGQGGGNGGQGTVLHVAQGVIPPSGIHHSQPRPPINMGRSVQTQTNPHMSATGAPQQVGPPPRGNLPRGDGNRSHVGSQTHK